MLESHASRTFVLFLGVRVPSFDAEEWLSGVTAAACHVRSVESLLRARRQAVLTGQAAPSGPVVAHSPNVDVMAGVDALVDREAGLADELSSSMAEVADARAVFAGMRSVGGRVSDAGTVLELVHADLVPIRSVAASLGISETTARRRRALGVDWLDANGKANAKCGIVSRSVRAL